MQTNQQWCDNQSCADFRKTSSENIKVHSYVDRRYYCTTCHQTFSADKGTFFDTLRTDRHLLVDVVAMLVERTSLRAMSRIKHCAPNTILHWLDLAGQHAEAVSNHLIHSLHVTYAQIDELSTFVKKSRSISNQTIHRVLVTLGSGGPLLCRVICVWSTTSAITAARKKQPDF
jgi:transposase-like protein